MKSDSTQLPNHHVPYLLNVRCDSILVNELLQNWYDDRDISCIVDNFDQRLLGPITLLRDKNSNDDLFIIDGHRRVAACRSIGLTYINAWVITEDLPFLFYAFEELHEGARKVLTDLIQHSNALIRYGLGSRTEFDIESMQVTNLFRSINVSLSDNRSPLANNYYFTNRKAAVRAYREDCSGQLLAALLSAIKYVFPSEKRLHDLVFSGLLALYVERKEQIVGDVESFFVDLLLRCAITPRTTSRLIHEAKTFWMENYIDEWSARSSMKQYFVHQLDCQAC